MWILKLFCECPGIADPAHACSRTRLYRRWLLAVKLRLHDLKHASRRLRLTQTTCAVTHPQQTFRFGQQLKHPVLQRNQVYGLQCRALLQNVVRIALFLLFIWGVSLWPDIRRVYEYHGAEHKTVFAFENGDPLETAAVQKYSTFHPRCGTSFLMTVMLISIGFYMLVPVTTFWARFAVRVAVLPLIAGVSYEIIRFAAKHRGSLFALMTAPGLWLQRITTKPPSDEQAQCAIVALDHAMALEKERGGELVIA